MKKLIAAVALTAIALTACGGPDYGGNDVAGLTQDDHSDAVLAGVAGAAAGYMMGKSSTPSRPTTIIKQKVIVHQRPGYTPRPAYTPRSSSRSFFGSSSRSYRPSFSSRRR